MPGFDSRIPLQTRNPQINSPLDAYSRAIHIKGQAQQNKNLAARGVQLEQENRQKARELKGRDLYIELLGNHITQNPDRTVKTNQGAIEDGLMRGGFPDLAKKFRDGLTESAKKLSDMNLAELKEEEKKLELVGRLSGAVVDAFENDPETAPGAYQWAMGKAKEFGADEGNDEMPPEFSEEILPDLKLYRLASLSGKQQLDEARKKLERKEKRKEFQDFYGIFREDTGKPKNARTEREAMTAFDKLGQPSEGRTKTIGDRIYQMNSATGKYDRDIGPRPTSQRAEKTPETPQERERREAAAEYKYQQRVAKIKADRDKEMRAMREEEAASTDLPNYIDKQKGERVANKYKGQIKAAWREYQAEIGSSGSNSNRNGPQGPQGPVPMFNPSTGEFE